MVDRLAAERLNELAFVPDRAILKVPVAWFDVLLTVTVLALRLEDA
jgi:hypothetical protein